MTKNAAVKFGYHCHDLAQHCNDREVLESVAVIGKFDCRVFCHISSLGDKISNTAASIQPNPFWFWENIFIFFPKPKRFGCFVAAVLLILSPKELI